MGVVRAVPHSERTDVAAGPRRYAIYVRELYRTVIHQRYNCGCLHACAAAQSHLLGACRRQAPAGEIVRYGMADMLRADWTCTIADVRRIADVVRSARHVCHGGRMWGPHVMPPSMPNMPTTRMTCVSLNFCTVELRGSGHGDSLAIGGLRQTFTEIYVASDSQVHTCIWSSAFPRASCRST